MGSNDFRTQLTGIGGVFKLELFLPEEYPMVAPKIRFLTKIYHPNIDKLGRICMDTLKGTVSLSGRTHHRKLVSRFANSNCPPFNPGLTLCSQSRWYSPSQAEHPCIIVLY